MNLAIDRKALIAVQGAPVGTPWSQFLPASMLAPGAARPVYPNRPDLRAARRLVRRSGMRTPIDANLYYQAGEPGDTLARSVQRSAARIGIRLRLKGEDTSVYSTDVQDPRAARDDMAFGAWGEDFDDASTYFGPLLSTAAGHGGSNYGDYSDPALDRAIARIGRMPIGPKRSRAFSDLSTSVMRTKAPIVVFRLRRRAFLLSPRVTGFSYRPETGIDLGLIDLR
jgi:peptide/nickel transport system substrate-binding protein